MKTPSPNGSGFTLLWSKMLKSTLWMEDNPTRIVWVTLLLLKDEEGMIGTQSARVIAHEARVTEEEAAKALAIFLGPDPESHLENDEGRRLRKVPGGFQIINHEQYRYSSEVSREYWRVKKAEQRQRDAERMALAKQGRRRRVVENGVKWGKDAAGRKVRLRNQRPPLDEKQ